MSKIWEAFKEVLSEEQLSEEAKKRLFVKLIPTIAEAFNQILVEKQLSNEVKNSLLFKLIKDLVDIEPPTIEVEINLSPFERSTDTDVVELEPPTIEARINLSPFERSIDTDSLALEAPTIEEEVNRSPEGLFDQQIEEIKKNRDWIGIGKQYRRRPGCIIGVRPR